MKNFLTRTSDFLQWDIIVRRSSLVTRYNLPDYGSEPWTSLHEFDEIFDRKLGKPAVSGIIIQFPNTTCVADLRLPKLAFFKVILFHS